MPLINSVDARRLFTKTLIDVFNDNLPPTLFLQSFFSERIVGSKEVSYEVQRMSERLATDVRRGTEGERIDMSQFTEKVLVPPYYKPYFDATSLYFYDQLFGRGDVEITDETLNDWIQTVQDKLGDLTNLIIRSVEKQCSDVFMTGTVTLENNTNINYRRKAASLVDLGASNYWNDVGVDPTDSMAVAANFLRQVGKARSGTLNAVLGDDALNAFLGNSQVLEKLDNRRMNLGDISMPVRQMEAVGSTFHGQISAGNYRFNIWGYPEYYEQPAGTYLPYILSNRMLVLPQNPNFRLTYASVPKIMRDRRNAEFPEFIRQERGRFTIGNYIMQDTEEHIFDVKSAPLAIPVAVDQIHTTQVLA